MPLIAAGAAVALVASAPAAQAAALAEQGPPNHTLTLIVKGIKFGAILAMTAIGLSRTAHEGEALRTDPKVIELYLGTLARAR